MYILGLPGSDSIQRLFDSINKEINLTAIKNVFVSFQVLSVTSNSEYCEQFVAYACKMSRLLNTPGIFLLWWSINEWQHHHVQKRWRKGWLTEWRSWLLLLSSSFQMGSRTHGGSVEPMRGISTGAARDQESRSVPVGSNTTAPTPSTTATVTQTNAAGEWSLLGPLGGPYS